MRVVLWGKTAHEQRDRLKAYVTTPWEVISVPDESKPDELSRAVAFIGIGYDQSLKAWGDSLQLIHGIGAGVDLFDMDALPRGSVLCNVYEHEAPIAEYVLGAILRWTLRLDEVDRPLRQGVWERSGRLDGEPHGEVEGRTLGLVGYGHIGRAVAKRAKAFGMRVLAVKGAHPPQRSKDEYAEWIGSPRDLDEMIAASDFLVVCCPLSDSTRGLIGSDRIARMKRSAYLVNIARAEIVDEAALFAALERGNIAGAALDVWYQYPAPGSKEGPVGHYPWESLGNIVMTPHYSAWTYGMIDRRWRRIAENLDRFSRGEPLLNVVTVKASADSDATPDSSARP